MTLRPTPGAPADQSCPPLRPLFPIDVTTVTPASTRLSAATAVGYCGQLLKAAPMLMFTTFAWSASASSIAWMRTSLSVPPLQPKTR